MLIVHLQCMPDEPNAKLNKKNCKLMSVISGPSSINERGDSGKFNKLLKTISHPDTILPGMKIAPLSV